jgi:AN1-type zinc finger and ubiquitin domain-containing protein 1
MFEHLPPGCRVTVLVFREGEQIDLFRVIENEDGTYSPLSESWSGSSIR